MLKGRAEVFTIDWSHEILPSPAFMYLNDLKFHEYAELMKTLENKMVLEEGIHYEILEARDVRECVQESQHHLYKEFQDTDDIICLSKYIVGRLLGIEFENKLKQWFRPYGDTCEYGLQ